MTETVVVTGGGGFIGSHLVRRLLADGASVRIIDNFATGRRSNLEGVTGDLTLHEVSFTDLDVIRPIFKGANLVYHIGALPSVPRSVADPLRSDYNNTGGTLNVLVAARDGGVRRVIYAGSSSAYGDIQADYKVEHMTPRPLSPYGTSKLVGEYYGKAFTASYGLETVCTRFFNVFGPWQDPNSQYSAVIPKFINWLLAGEQPQIQGDGTQSRDFTYIDNVIHGLRLAADAPRVNGLTVNLAAGGNVRLLDLLDHLNKLIGTNIEPVFVDPRPGDVRHSQADITRATELMGYKPIVSFVEGLKRTIDYYR